VTIRLLGVDTGWRATGFCLVEWDGEHITVSDWTTCYTEPTPAQRRESKIADDERRIREIQAATEEAIRDRKPDLVAVEALSLGAPNVMSIVQQTKGYTAALCACLRAGVAIRQIAPQDVRRALGVPPGKKGEKKPEKKAAVRRAVERHASIMLDALAVPDPVAEKLTEHEWDAAAVAVACLVPSPVDLVLAVQAGRGQ
jgi:Holliday junction resolvasome RuvABC endonuclease subunit